MSNIPPFSREENSSSHTKEKPQFKRPEFILIDDRCGESQYTHFGADSSRKPNHSFQAEKECKSSKGPLSLRFICLLGLIFCFVFGLGMLIWSIALTFLATISLFQNRGLNQGLQSLWKICANTFIAGFGFMLGLMSPTLGLGLLALYFSLKGELVNDDILRKVIRRSFNQM
jgi:hypothetical protein